MVHLEETLKIEENESRLLKNMKVHKSNSATEEKLIARKEQEVAAQEVQLQQEEGKTRSLVKDMVDATDKSLTPITKVLSHFEGMI